MQPRLAVPLLTLALGALAPDLRTASAALTPLLQTPEVSRGAGEVRDLQGNIAYYYIETASPTDFSAADSLYFFRAGDLALERQWAFLPGVVPLFSPPVISRIWCVGDVDGNGIMDVVLQADRYNTSALRPGKPTVYLLDLSRGPVDPIATWEDPDDTTAYEIASLGATDLGFRLAVRRTHTPNYVGFGGTSLLVYGIDAVPVAVPDGAPSASPGFALHAGAPNPFREETAITYELARPSTVRLAIYDVGGRVVRATPERVEAPGSHTYRWDGRDDAGAALPPGLYLYELRANGETQAKKTFLVR